ncbi:MAG: serine/threonine protein kinase [Gemmatimonadota bacterium]|nr:serine/threonine protein kinase [Gemmatimonadota bacterium]
MNQQTQSDPLFLGFQLAVAGRYSIDRELGRGGMGVVYLAREVHLDRLVAIKLLPPDRSAIATLRDRFLREARLAAKLSHPHIIPIHAVDEVAGFVFYVMSYVDGETLAQRVRHRGPMSASDGSRVLREAAWALAYAHSQGLVHRDVKPDNILIEFSTGRALVADFGIAAAAGEASADGVSGTPEFMSPEQALGRDIDARSDLYGLGATAFYAFSGRLPFEGDSATQILARQVTEAPPPLGSMGIAVPRKLAQLVDRCLAKDPAHRPASAEALAEQLGVAMDQRREMPVALRAFVRRNGRMDGGGTLLFGAALLIGSSIGSAAFGVGQGFATFAVGVTLTPFAFAVLAARRLTRLGFAHADLGPAFRAEVENSREERAVEHGRGRSVVEWFMSRTVRVFGSFTVIAASVIAAAKLFGASTPLADAAVPITITSAVIAVISGTAYLGVLQARRDVDTEFWSSVWMGRVGRLAFAMGRRLQGRQQATTAMTHRATELSLGMAAEQLFESLPRETRHALGDLPALLHRLQTDAQLLRRSYDELQDALGSARLSSTDDYESLRADRDLVHEKLGDAVGALETIRLNLLRLHAGSATVEGLTTHIGLAVEVSAEVERLIAAREEVESGLRFPRDVELTPV